MKKILSIAMGAAVMSGVLSSCADSDFNDKYSDPSKTDKVSINQVFSGVMNAGKTWMTPFYYRYYTQTTTSGTFSGVIGNANGRGRFRGATEGPFNTRWKDFYNMVTQYRVLEQNYNEMEPDNQEENKIFFLMGRTLVESQLHEMLSLFGPVPFKQAGNLWKDAKFEDNKPAYDSDVELYKMILADLKEAGDFLAGDVNATGASAFGRADFTNAHGKLDIWQRYVNSLRLRVALHLVNGDLADDAKAAIKEILENPTRYPVIENNNQNMVMKGDASNDDYNFGKSFSQALHTSGGSYAVVSQAMLDALNIKNGLETADSDPRVQAMLDPNPNHEYVAYDVKLANAAIDNLASDAEQKYTRAGLIGAHYYARLDSQAIAGVKEYNGNANTQAIWLSAAEVSLSKAEAYLMGYGVAKDAAKAEELFKKGVVESCEYYWATKLNSSYYTAGNDSYAGFRALTVPTAADYEAYAAKAWDGTQKAVATQLWLNHGVWNELEAWNVVRRTGYPEVQFAEDGVQTAYALPPLRLPYPTDESSYNSANYKAAVDKYYNESTGYYTKLFWSKDKYYNIVAKH